MKSGEQTQNTYAIYPVQTKQILRAVAEYIHSILVLLLLLLPTKRIRRSRSAVLLLLL